MLTTALRRVDAFRYNEIEGCRAYFLTHAHSDHFQQLSKTWKVPIYCSQTTANLIKLKLGVPDEYLNVLPMDTPVYVEGIKVTLIDANHCPGAVLFVFEGQHTAPSSPHRGSGRPFRYLHCGDFRASPAMLNHPALKGKKVDACYLDTTYFSSPTYCFPAQPLVVQACSDLVKARVEGDDLALSGKDRGAAELMKGWLEAKAELEAATGEKLDLEPDVEVEVKPKQKERLLVLVGTYSIGKERLAKGQYPSLTVSSSPKSAESPLCVLSLGNRTRQQAVLRRPQAPPRPRAGRPRAARAPDRRPARGPSASLQVRASIPSPLSVDE